LYRLRDSELLVENRGVFIPNLYLALHQGVTRWNFVKMFDSLIHARNIAGGLTFSRGSPNPDYDPFRRNFSPMRWDLPS